MYQESIEKICKSIFPIFFERHQENQITIGVSGTGFFVSNEGHFVTAHHITTDIPAGSKLLYCGNVPFSPLGRPIEIEEISSDIEKDIFIGKVAQDALPPLKLAEQKAKPGKSVCLCGYPLARLARNQNGSIDVRNVRQYWQPTFVIDYITATVNQKKYEGFMTQHTSLRGMSGGPVFDSEGLVYGVDVATLTRKIPESAGEDTIIPNGVVVDVSTIRRIINSNFLLK